jgi:hypothetical protein
MAAGVVIEGNSDFSQKINIGIDFVFDSIFQGVVLCLFRYSEGEVPVSFLK